MTSMLHTFSLVGSWWKSLVCCSHTYTLFTLLYTLTLKAVSRGKQRYISAPRTVPPQRPAGCLSQRPSHCPLTLEITGGHQDWDHFETCHFHIMTISMCDACVCPHESMELPDPFPHTCISSTQSHSICMEIWAPQLESSKALSSTNSYYRFGLLSLKRKKNVKKKN